MTKIEEKRFNEFRNEVLKYDIIDIDTLLMLIRRYTSGWMGRRFLKEEWKMRYYTFWIKRLEGNILKSKGYYVWEVIK